jgi:hypothetical protein
MRYPLARRAAALAAAAVLPLTLIAPASASTINRKCGAWHGNGPVLDDARACVTVWHTVESPGDGVITHLKVCIQGEPAVDPAWADARVNGSGGYAYPRKDGTSAPCIHWSRNIDTDADNISVRVWGRASVPIVPDWEFDLWVYWA